MLILMLSSVPAGGLGESFNQLLLALARLHRPHPGGSRNLFSFLPKNSTSLLAFSTCFLALVCFQISLWKSALVRSRSGHLVVDKHHRLLSRGLRGGGGQCSRSRWWWSEWYRWRAHGRRLRLLIEPHHRNLCLQSWRCHARNLVRHHLMRHLHLGFVLLVHHGAVPELLGKEVGGDVHDTHLLGRTDEARHVVGRNAEAP